MADKINFADRVRKDLILIGVEGDTREEVLTNISKVLIEKGIAKETYTEGLLQRESEFPTGLPIGEYNIAIPHTYPEHCNEIAVTVAIPKKPIEFHNMGDASETVMVYVILCLCLKKMDDSINMLPSLMTFFADEENVKTLMKCKTPDEVMEAIQAAKKD